MHDIYCNSIIIQYSTQEAFARATLCTGFRGCMSNEDTFLSTCYCYQLGESQSILMRP